MSTITALMDRVKDNVKDDHSWVSETAYVQAIKDAVIIYSKHRPIVKAYTLSLQANVSTYSLPDDFLFFVLEPSISSWLYPDGNVRVTPNGLVPIPLNSQLPESIRVQGKQLYVSPTPTYNCDVSSEYAARHVITDPDVSPDEYATLREDEDIIVVSIAEAIIIKVMARRADQEADYAEGDTKIDFSTRAKQYDNLAKKAEGNWRRMLGLSYSPLEVIG